MQKSHSKLGLLVVLSCLTLALLVATPASAHQSGQRRTFVLKPHISMRLLHSFQRDKNSYVTRAIIYGAGFNDCSSLCNTGCYGPSNGDCSNQCSNGCSSSSGNACSSYYTTVNTCGSSNSACSSNNSSCATSSTTTCSSNCGAGSSSACDCGSSNNTTCASTSPSCGSSNTTSCSSTSPSCASSNNTPCSSTSPSCASSNSTSCASDNNCGSSSVATCSYDCGTSSNNACDCNTVNLQSNANISGQNVNLSQVPVNAFGEFRVTVVLRVAPRVHRTTNYNVWAVNSYNSQRSNVVNDTCSCD